MSTSRQQFLAERKKGIGGSDCAAILGVSPWATRLDVYLDKVGEAKDMPESEAMRFGTLLEPLVREEYARRTDNKVVHSSLLNFVSEAHPFMRANLDGIAEVGGQSRVLEIKTARTADGWGEIGSDEIPIQYNAQVQHYMCVTGFARADIAVLIGGSDFRIYTVEADAELHQAIIEREHDFWHNHVLSRVPPEPEGAEDLVKMFAKDNGNAFEADHDLFLVWSDLHKAKAEAKAIEESIETFEFIIKSAMKDCAEMRFHGDILATWKTAKDSKRFDAKAFQAAHPDLATPFIHHTQGSRRFILKEPKT